MYGCHSVLVVDPCGRLDGSIRHILSEHGIAVRLAQRTTNADLARVTVALIASEDTDLQRLSRQNIAREIVVCGGAATPAAELAARAGGASDYLPAGMCTATIIARVCEAIERHDRMSERTILMHRWLDAQRCQTHNAERTTATETSARLKRLERENRRLKRLSLTDDVTGLYNQRYIFQRLEEEYRRWRRYGASLSAMMIDIDHFKRVNDGHDHLFGSRVLHQIGDILRGGVRQSDVVARYGGDEFSIIMPHTGLHTAAAVGCRLRCLVRDSEMGEDPQRVRVTVSIGVATLGDARSPRELLRAADKAMYWAKARGRDRVATMNDTQAVALVG